MFSHREELIIKTLGRKTMCIQLISEVIFMDDPKRPFDADVCVRNSIGRIIKKCKHHKLEWTLFKNKKGLRTYIKKGDI
jgi:hypothetical protein